MLIVGEKEAAEGKVSVRKQGGEDVGQLAIGEFADKVLAIVNDMMTPKY
jgi:threonyl-tRNA synthetase